MSFSVKKNSNLFTRKLNQTYEKHEKAQTEQNDQEEGFEETKDSIDGRSRSSTLVNNQLSNGMTHGMMIRINDYSMEDGY